MQTTQQKAKARTPEVHLTLDNTPDNQCSFKMAAASMGAFGTYKLQYNRYLQERGEQERQALGSGGQTVWVTKRYNPQDLRVLAPVPRHKLVVSKMPTPAEQHWVPVTDPPLRSFEHGRSHLIFASYPSSRSEDWSTLRQMLPTSGCPFKVRPPSWGTGQGPPPMQFERSPTRLPKVNSPMTRYADDMHGTNRLFKLH